MGRSGSGKRDIPAEDISKLIRGDKETLTKYANEGGNPPKASSELENPKIGVAPAELDKKDLAALMKGDILTLTKLAFQDTAIGREAKQLLLDMAANPKMYQDFASGKAQAGAKKEGEEHEKGSPKKGKGHGMDEEPPKVMDADAREPWWMHHGNGLGNLLFGSGKGSGTLYAGGGTGVATAEEHIAEHGKGKKGAKTGEKPTPLVEGGGSAPSGH